MSKLTVTIDPSIIIRDIDGNEMREGDVTITIGKLLISAFSRKSPMQDPRLPNNNISEEEQFDRWMVALRVKNAANLVEMTRDELTKARRLIAERFDITYTARAKEIFEAAIKAADAADPPA